MSDSSRRQFLRQAAGAAAALAAGAASGQSAQPPRRPNLVYVLADQLRYQSCGYAGDEYSRTPNIDALARQAISFNNAISSTPLCSPYRAALMTGKFQSSTGMVINELRLSPEHECFGHVLTRGGYHTAYIGKWHMWANSSAHQETRSGFVPPGPYRLGFDGEWVAYNFNHQYVRAPYFRDRPEREFFRQFEPDAQTGLAIDFIRSAARKSEPFAMFLAWGPPHDPWSWDNVSPEYAEMFRNVEIPLRRNFSDQNDPYGDAWARLPRDYRRQVVQFQQAYYALTANIDWNLGRLMQALEQAGVAGNTVLVFTSDHGEMFGAHGRQKKLIFYEEAVRVPFLIRWPGRIKAGSVSDACLGSPDIMPTLLSLMGLRSPRTVEGTDLSGLALGRGRSEPDAAYLQGMGTTAAWQDGTEWRAMRDKQYTYGIYRRDGRELLFDNIADPCQMKDLAGEGAHASRLAHYRQQLAAWRKRHNDTFESCTWYRDHWTSDRNIILTATGVKQDLKALDELMQKTYPDGGARGQTARQAPVLMPGVSRGKKKTGEC
jgi:arylsulfatase A-like enzyme